MARERNKQTFKLRILASVLALALVWYSLNPAPRPAVQKKREAQPPDEKKRDAEPRRIPATLPTAFRPAGTVGETLPPSKEDDFEWPEFIDG